MQKSSKTDKSTPSYDPRKSTFSRNFDQTFLAKKASENKSSRLYAPRNLIARSLRKSRQGPSKFGGARGLSVFRTVAAKKGSIYPSRRAFTAAKHAPNQSTVLLALPWYNGMPKLTSVLEKERVRAFTAQNSTVSPPRRASTVAQCSKPQSTDLWAANW